MATRREINRREFLRQSSVAAAALGTGFAAGPVFAARSRKSGIAGKKVIVIGVDGMDPGLSEKMMNAGQLPNFDKLRKQGGFRQLGTSIPPQSPVAWANFINGSGPGSHGIFDFIHRNPDHQCAPFYSAAETIGGAGYWEIGDHKIQLDFWPFNHKPAATVLRREGTPFWDYLDEAGISSTFYDLPSNYPPSPSKYGNHRCLAGMGTPDLLGNYGGYHHFSEDGPVRMEDQGGCKRSMLFFEMERAKGQLIGPMNTFLKSPKPATIDFEVYRDKQSRAAAIDVQGRRIMLKEGQWSDWIRLDYELGMPILMPDQEISGICRFYLQEVEPNFRLYVSPVNSDPSNSALQITEPAGFIGEISDKLGLFYTTGFQEDYKALQNSIFTDDEYKVQAESVLQERLNLLDYALDNYDDGLLFFYFSSADLQAHMFWWDSEERHPFRSDNETVKCFDHLKGIYRRMDEVLGNILAKYNDKATIFVMSDHGFANFRRQFNLNSWLRENGYLWPPDAEAVLRDTDWSVTRAYGLGINSLYLNQAGREKYGIVQPGREKNELLDELVSKLEAIRDENGQKIIRHVHRSDMCYSGEVDNKFTPDLIVGYARGYRASWATCLGDMTDQVLLDNDKAWSADHCADVLEVPGVIFCNRPIANAAPSLIDLAPTIMNEFGLPAPDSITGTKIL
ncbi:MAG: alkaline phosphatase family protein [Sedimentisphaerales bacterium]|nr:alkaline phosphatase family protein [Sedimentisphaerales bacterium]